MFMPRRGGLLQSRRCLFRPHTKRIARRATQLPRVTVVAERGSPFISLQAYEPGAFAELVELTVSLQLRAAIAAAAASFFP
jgi:hypothetical protein